jgi:hypothetical protein
MKCSCCSNGNIKNIDCDDCKKIVCNNCIHLLIKNENVKLYSYTKEDKIKICKTCLPKKIYQEYSTTLTEIIKRDIEEGLLIQCEYCLNIWDGHAQCNCSEYWEYMEQIENTNVNENENIYNNQQMTAIDMV